MSDFPTNILKRLMWDGWHQGRNVEPWDQVAQLDRCGYPVFPAAWRFLVQFGGLVLWRELGRRFCHGEPAALDFSLREVILPYDSPEMRALISGTGLTLCYVGEFVYPDRPGHAVTLMIDERGTFYRYMARASLDLIGHTAADMVTNFYDGLHSVQRVFTLVLPLGGSRPNNRKPQSKPPPTPAYSTPFYSSSSH